MEAFSNVVQFNVQAAPSTPKVYTRTFAGYANENPLSDGGQWVKQGLRDGVDWNNTRTNGSIALHSNVNQQSYRDAISCLSGFAPDQWAEGTVYRASNYPAAGTSPYHEIELLLRWQITSSPERIARGYEITWGMKNSTTPYFLLVVWKGWLGGFKYLINSDQGGPNPLGTPQTGDRVRAQIVGKVIKVYKNDIEVLSYTTSVATDEVEWSDGNPGMGFCLNPANEGSGAVVESFGWSTYSAGDYTGPPATNDLDAAVQDPTFLVGTWKQFKTSAQFPAFESGNFWYEPNEHVLDFTHKGWYDAAAKRVLVVAASYNQRHSVIAYDQLASSGAGAWTRAIIGVHIIHIWDHLAYNPATAKLRYYSELGGNTMQLLATSGNAATIAATKTDLNNTSISGSTDNPDTSTHNFFAARNEFIRISRYGNVQKMADSATNWTTHAYLGIGDHGFSMVSAYDPIGQILYFGGGQNEAGTGKPNTLRKLDASLNHTLITAGAPYMYAAASWLMPVRNQAGTETHLIVFNKGGFFNISTDGGAHWGTNQAMPSGSYNASGRMVVIPLTNHPSGRGVVLVVDGMSSQAWLYRYS